jgi:glycosyltransferase involved in cell wall biosynthesis
VADYFRECLPSLSGICFDNDAFRRHLIDLYGVDRRLQARLRTIYQPHPSEASTGDAAALIDRLGRDDAYRRKVLWASRIDAEKRPDVLVDVARSLPDMDFVAYGSPVLGEDNPLSRVELENFDYRGGFDDFFDLPLAEFDLFLYTSRMDGLPNIVLEAMQAGLPIIAPAVGGIPELVTETTGWPVDSSNGVDAYCRALRAAASAPQDAKARREAGLELIERRHSWGGYVEALRNCGILL